MKIIFEGEGIPRWLDKQQDKVREWSVTTSSVQPGIECKLHRREKFFFQPVIMGPLVAIAPDKWIDYGLPSHYSCSFWSCSACFQLNHLGTCGRLPKSRPFFLLKAECFFSCRAQSHLWLGGGGGGWRMPSSALLARTEDCHGPWENVLA